MLSIFDNGPPAPVPAPFNMAAHVLQHAKTQPKKLALQIIHADYIEDWTYAQIESAVRGIARGLIERGAQTGDLILIRLGNTVDYPLAYLAALSAGMVPVPLSPALTTPEIERILDDLNPKLILHDPKLTCPKSANRLPLKQLQEMQNLPPAQFHHGDPNRLGYVVYTSGTSGTPRAVAHAHRAIWARQMMFQNWYDLRQEDRVLHAGAFNWTYTMGTGLMDPWTIGATALIPAADTPLERIPSMIQNNQVSIFAAAPGVYRQILRMDKFPLTPVLRHGLSAGEKLPEEIKNKWIKATNTQIFEAYGMSECSTFISGSPSKPPTDNSLGQAQNGRRIAILGPDGPVKRGEEGTIAIHRDDPGLMLGYLNAVEETQSKMQDEWFLTGDQGVMHPNDQITYLGRNDDMMNAGGFRVSPIEVEQIFQTMRGITAVAVTQIEIKPGTYVIAAFYTGPENLLEQRLKSHAEANLARYKQPRLYRYVQKLPIGANGKLLRKALRDEFIKGR